MDGWVEIGRDGRCQDHEFTISKRVDGAAYSASCECGETWDADRLQWLSLAAGRHIGYITATREQPIPGISTGPELMARDFPPTTARDLLTADECDPACLLALGPVDECTCKCNG